MKIGIVEDEAVIAELIKMSLVSFGYEVIEPVENYTEAIKMITTQKPDLVILDIHLAGTKSGIDLAEYINKEHNIPFIFLTAFADKATVEKAKPVNPSAYLIKPFKQEELFTTIEISLNNFNKNYATNKPEQIEDHSKKNDYIFIKEGLVFQKIFVNDIIFLESEHVYVTIHTTTKKHLVRTTMKDILETLDQNIFIRIHKSFSININHVQSVDTYNVKIGDAKLPVGKNHKEVLFKKLGL